MNKLIRNNLLADIFILFIIFPAALFAQAPEGARDLTISKTLDIIEAHKDLKSPQTSSYPSKTQEDYSGRQDEEEFDNPLQYLIGKRSYFTLGLLSGYVNGRTRYHIQFDNPYAIGGHGESELDWPLSNALIGLVTSINYRLTDNLDETRDRAKLELTWFMRRIDKSSGKIEDSDWIENDVGYLGGGTNNPGKDIYSEMNAKLDDVRIIDVNYIYNFWLKNNFAIGPRLGVRAQKFNFSSYDLDQVGYGSYASGYTYRDTRGRKWLEYKANYSIPYFGLGSEYRLKDNLNLLFSFGYSTWVHIKDADTHLYPTEDEAYGYNYHDMLSEGHCDGHAYLWGIRGSWRITPDWLLNIGGSYVDLEAKGNMVQKQYYDGALYSISNPIGERITSEYWLADLSLSFIF